MKKLLLSLAVVFGFGFSYADDVTINTADAADFNGTLVDEVKNDDGSVKAAKHYQPLNSLSISGFSFSFTKGESKTEPAFYWPTSTSTTGKTSIRIYSGNTMTVTAPTTVKFTTVTIIPDNSTKETVIYSGEEANSFTYTATATTRINTIIFSNGGGTPTPDVKSANNIKEFYSLGEGEDILVNFPMTVTYVYGVNCYAVDAEGTPTLIYGSNPYKELDVIPAGWKGKYSPYAGMPEIKPSGDLPSSTAQGSFKPSEVELSNVTADMVNSVVVIKNVKFDSATPVRNADSKAANFTGANSDGSSKLTFRTNFFIESVEAGVYDVKAAIATYNGAVQVYPISYQKSGGSAVESIAVDESEAVYYDLNGRKVAGDLVKGIYVKILGGKSSKVIVR